jgi:hypothetical protein
MNRVIKTGFWVVLLTTAVLAFSASAQRIVPNGTPAWDTAKNPHDFILDYYYKNGVMSKLMVWRRTGADGLSVFGKSSNPFHNPVRVTVTVPAYDQSANVQFWYPLGEFTEMAFMDTEMGILARETAKRFPIYIFPDEKYISNNTIANTRQAPVIDNTWAFLGDRIYPNPLGLREVFAVTYTAKAHTKDAYKVMQYMANKNGLATDDMPIINSIADIHMLSDGGFISLDVPGDGPFRGHYAVAPLIRDPRNGVIAKDAFLWMSTKYGLPLDSEMTFVNEFECLQVKGAWCKEVGK